jgi:hypothetical protein
LRETINKSKSGMLVLGVLLLAGSTVAIIVQARNMGPKGGVGDAYFTVDDGKTFFVGDRLKISPFEHEGKQAVRAHVFECGGKRVVGYMSRFTPESIQVLNEAKASRASGKPPANIGKLQSLGTTGTEMKRPGSEKWILASDPGAQSMRVFKCPDGKVVSEVLPDDE